MTTLPHLQMPYIGLRPFDELDEPLFFGREAQVSQMLRQLEDHPFLAVVGASGSGKSSLVRAGLLPAIKQGFLLGAANWSISVVRPGHEPYQRLAEALIHASNTNPSDPISSIAVQQRDAIVARLRSSDLGIRAALNELDVERSVHALIVVDQFEELFAFRRTNNRQDEFAARDEASAFVRALLRGSSDPHSPVRVIVTMRSDFIGDAEAFLGLPEAVSRNQFLVPRLNRHQMQEAIVGPSLVGNAGYRPFSLDGNLVNRIVNDAGDRPDQLPLMQHALMCTWKMAVARGADGAVLLQSDYDAAGGIERALSRHADAAWHQLQSTRLEHIAKRLFLLLCDVSPDGQITRRRPRIDEVQTVAGASLEEIAEIVKIFQEDDRNFLLPPLSSSLTVSTSLDISHESLIRQWKRFNEWVSEETASAATFQRLRESAVRWPQQEPLLRDPALTLAVNWLNEQSPSSAWANRYGGELDRVKNYVQQSQDAQLEEAAAADFAREKELADSRRREAEEAANARTFRRWTIALAVLCVVALGSLCYSVIVRGKNVSLIGINEGLAAAKKDLETRNGGLEARNRGLGAEEARLKNEIDEAQKEFASLNVQVATLNATKSTLESRQQQLDLHTAALSKVVAHGTVQQANDGTVEVAFQQSIPDGVLEVLSSVGRIRKLNLRRSSITDAGLKSLANITGLVELDLSNTDIGDAGVQRIAELTGVRRLLLNDTRITDASEAVLRTFTRLERLELHRTRMSPQTIERLRDALGTTQIEHVPDPLLQALATSGGDWDTALKAANATRDGGTIRFNNSEISDAALKFLDEFNDVQLSGCRNITSEGLRSLARHKGINRIVLRKMSQANDEGIDALLQLPNLTELELDSMGITDRSLFNMARVKGLTTLRLIRSSSDLTPAGLGQLASLPALRHLALEYDLDVTPDALNAVSKLPALEILSLKGAQLSGVDVGALASIPRLRRLDLSHSQISRETTRLLTKVKSLQTLDVSATSVFNEDLAVLTASNPKLEIISGGADLISVPQPEENGLRRLRAEGRTLKYGETVAGTLAGDAPIIAGRPSLAWQLTACPADGQVQVDLMSRAFDAYLIIEAGSSDPLRVNDDGGSGQNSRLVVPCRESGYKVIVSSLDRSGGNFELRAGPRSEARAVGISEEPLRALKAEPEPLAIGAPIGARLQAMPGRQGEAPAMAWDLGECVPGTQIQLDLKSADFDPLLVVIDKGSGDIYNNDDGGERLDARLKLRCPSSGMKVIATTVEGVGRFEVSATLSRDSAAQKGFREMPSEPEALGLDKPVTAQLRPQDRRVEGQPVKAWNLGGCAPGRRVEFDLRSDDFDPKLVVIDNATGMFIEDDDGGLGLNSHVLLPCQSRGFKVIVTSVEGFGAFALTASLIRD